MTDPAPGRMGGRVRVATMVVVVVAAVAVVVGLVGFLLRVGRQDAAQYGGVIEVAIGAVALVGGVAAWLLRRLRRQRVPAWRGPRAAGSPWVAPG